ncbi:hypothetical protein Tsubulata_020361 [Turnera subulata]|uniref:RRM domain-containing protein n=1 Tax=Turnera subulata TaxID=218843 RepID=A0A9Q0FAF0_9ROSI|nr:hypothetical protein Tsubulata_020361 [Turnera subulata]
MDNGQEINLYVENLPSSWESTNIYRIMSKYGEVIDVYVPVKKIRQGKRFCFVRFRGIGDMQCLLDDANRIHVEKCLIRANMARQRMQNWQEQRNTRTWMPPQRMSRITNGKYFIDAVKGSQTTGQSNPQLKTKSITTSKTLTWLSRCVVGILRNPTDIESVQYVWATHGYADVRVSRLGGDSILANFLSQESMLRFVEEYLA